jgi:Uma2 family endonuclease
MATLAQGDLSIDVTQEGVLLGLPMPLTVRPAAPMSDEELIAFSRRNRPYRIERNAEGELEIMSPTGGEGSRWESRVIRELDIWAEENGGASFSSSGGFRLPDGSVLSADAAFVSGVRWNALSKADRHRFPPLCPDFVIEILSESDSRARLQAKMETWIANGAQLAWTIDPFAATVSIYRPNQAPEVLERPDSVEANEVEPGFRLATQALWAE